MCSILHHGFFCVILAVLYLTSNVLSSPAPSSGSSRHSHRLSQMKHLREELDRALLKQQTDHIYLRNLKKDFDHLQKKFDYVKHETQEELSTLVEDVKTVQRTSQRLESSTHLLTEERNTQFHDDDNSKSTATVVDNEAYEALRKDFLHLKSEMEALKMNCQSIASEGHALREESAMSWLLQVVPELQKSVKDIQESTNLLQEMHNKKDIDLRMAALTADVSSVDEKMIKINARIEASGAIAQTLTQELAENSGKIHHLQNKAAITEEKLEEQTETVDNLLKSLPDGFLQKDAPKTKEFALAYKMRPMVSTEDPDGFHKRFEKLELKTSSIDFALMNLQKKIFLKETKQVREKDNEPINVSDRLDEVEDELSKIKHSSASLLKILSEFGKEDSESNTKMHRLMAQLQSKLDKEKQDRMTSDDAESLAQKELQTEEHTDIYEFKRIINRLSSRVTNLETQASEAKEMEPKTDPQLQSSQSNEYLWVLEDKLTSTDDRLSTLEKQFRRSFAKNRKHRHHHDPET